MAIVPAGLYEAPETPEEGDEAAEEDGLIFND